MNIQLIKYLHFVLFIACLSAGTINLQGQVQPSAGLQAAIVKIDITPPGSKNLLGYDARASDGIHSRIYHTILLLDDGHDRFLLVSSDLCMVSPSEYDRLAVLIEKRNDIPPIHFWWSVTHTHSAPEVGPPGLAASFMEDRYQHAMDTAYTHFVEEVLLEGVSLAIRQLAPATITAGWGYSNANINRRTWGVDKKAIFGMNPDGAADRRIGVLKLQHTDGSLMGVVANYPIHATVLGPQNFRISSDVTGMVADYVETKTGAPVLFINGAAGNLAPIYSVYPSPGAGHLDQFQKLLGDKIIEAVDDAWDLLDIVRLKAGMITVQTPGKPMPGGWPNELDKYRVTAADGSYLINLPVRFLQLHPDMIIWSAPVELFCEISNNIRDQSPWLYTYYFGYTNGWLGYLPTAASWDEGGYEVHTVSPYTISAEKDLRDAVLTYLQSARSLKEPARKQKKNSKTKMKK